MFLRAMLQLAGLVLASYSHGAKMEQAQIVSRNFGVNLLTQILEARPFQ
jgi:hypothetical protein